MIKTRLLRVIRILKIKMISVAEYPFVFLYAVPVLRFKKELGPRFSYSRGFNSHLLSSTGSFLKLAIFSSSRLKLEYANYRRLLNFRPDLIDILPAYRFFETAGFGVLVCQEMVEASPAEALNAAAVIHRRFPNEDISYRTNLKLTDCSRIEAGIRLVEAEVCAATANALRSSAEEFLASGLYTIGVTHGDFHSRNLMFDELGNSRLIDLDCVGLRGITELDALYFSLEYEWSASGRLWLQTLADSFVSKGQNIMTCLTAFSVGWSTNLGIAFLLDRTGQDFLNYGLRQNNRYFAEAINAALDAINKTGSETPTIPCEK